jgi:single-strand DNA-binding protein
MTDFCSQNQAELAGEVLDDPVFSHENHGVRFCRFAVRVPRLSGQADTLPVLAAEPLARRARPGETVRLTGQLRSFNNKSGRGSRLVLSFYARSLEAAGGESTNRVLLAGSLCRPPVLRRTPLGRTICDLMLAVTRRCGRADYLPVIAWGQLAVAAGGLRTGDRLALEGRFQSRGYSKVTPAGTEARTAYEVSVLRFRSPESAPEEGQASPCSLPPAEA